MPKADEWPESMRSYLPGPVVDYLHRLDNLRGEDGPDHPACVIEYSYPYTAASGERMSTSLGMDWPDGPSQFPVDGQDVVLNGVPFRVIAVEVANGAEDGEPEMPWCTARVIYTGS